MKKKKKKTNFSQKNILIVFFLIASLLTLVIAIQYAQTNFLPKANQGTISLGRLENSNCNMISFPNNKRVYLPGETIPITYDNPNKPHDVKLYFSDTFSPTPN